ncbi:hypothetical protein [Streptomyces bluensis]|uniref:hypothetical protein n=1 Tax=Streptomyces bluensis TaxID=33897 RepID=UPI00167A2F40|nr:hypothetical protein [Streptomyces bluensis]GGZ79619.1 hypothetical protein GCM10010344_53390 [Streptomyces bluensis]
MAGDPPHPPPRPGPDAAARRRRRTAATPAVHWPAQLAASLSELDATWQESAQLAQLFQRLADEATGPLATARGLVEHAAHRLGALPDAYGPAWEHQLE